MTRRRVWYAKYIGYCFTDNGEEVILEDVFYGEFIKDFLLTL